MNPLARHGGLTYLEIPALDPPLGPRRSGAFYASVLGWKIDPRSEQDLRFSDGAGQLIGRFALGRAVAREPGLTPIFYVDGLDAAVARAVESGGEVVRPPFAEGDVRVAHVRDPAGNLIGLWQLGGG
jgi:predicted enzyme related to lactoylglutathione lyase